MMLSNRFVRILALLLAFVLVAPSVSATEEECADPNAVVADPNCPDRDHVVLCAGKYLDKNQNGLLERSELQGAIDELPWYVFHAMLEKQTVRVDRFLVVYMLCCNSISSCMSFINRCLYLPSGTLAVFFRSLVASTR
jgi:hypothetical protein